MGVRLYSLLLQVTNKGVCSAGGDDVGEEERIEEDALWKANEGSKLCGSYTQRMVNDHNNHGSYGHIRHFFKTDYN